MIEETGNVVAVLTTEGGHQAWVETTVKATCSSCKASESCPTTTIAKAFSPKPEHILIDTPCLLAVGQQVKIGIHESALLTASSMIYLLPLVVLILSSSVLTLLFPYIHELLVLTLGCIVSFISYWWVSAMSKKKKNRQKFRPVFLGATQDPIVTRKHEIPVHKL